MSEKTSNISKLKDIKAKERDDDVERMKEATSNLVERTRQTGCKFYATVIVDHDNVIHTFVDNYHQFSLAEAIGATVILTDHLKKEHSVVDYPSNE